MVFDGNVNDLSYFFEKYANIISLDFSYFDSSNVINMEGMFYNCQILKEIKGLNKIKTNKVIFFDEMFAFCFELKYLDLSGFDTSNVDDMSLMFYECKTLEKIKGLDEFNTSKVTDMEGMFSFCFELKYLNLSILIPQILLIWKLCFIDVLS